MKRQLIVFGLILLGSLLILGSTARTQAQDGEDREFVGARECSFCHDGLSDSHDESPHGLALIKSSDENEFFVADFATDDAVRNVQLPGTDETRAFSIDDIAYAIGSGQKIQRYVYELESDEGDSYVVLPAQWNVAAGAWEPYGPVENFPDDPAYDFDFSCAGCHTTGYNAQRVRWEDDGVQCEACHGPGSEHVDTASDAGNNPNDEEYQAILDAIVVSPDAAICGQCHSQGTEPTNNHPFPVDYVAGGVLLDPAVFALVAPDDEAHWWPTGHASSPNMQYNELLKSAHGHALETLIQSGYASDECLACHSGDYRFVDGLIEAIDSGDRDAEPPDELTLETATMGLTCITCHNPHNYDTPFSLQEEDAETLCTECHTDNTVNNGLHHPVKEMVQGIALVEGVEGIASGHFTNEDGPECVTCHMPRVPLTEGGERESHTVMVVLPEDAATVEGLQDACSACHGEEIEAMGLQGFIDDVQTNISTRLDAIDANLNDDSPEWMNTAVAFVEGDNSQGVHNYAYADALLKAVETELQLNGNADDVVATPVNTVLEDLEENTPETDFGTAEEDEGLAPQAIVIMVLSLLLIVGAGYSFFIKKEANS